MIFILRFPKLIFQLFWFLLFNFCLNSARVSIPTHLNYIWRRVCRVLWLLWELKNEYDAKNVEIGWGLGGFAWINLLLFIIYVKYNLDACLGKDEAELDVSEKHTGMIWPKSAQLKIGEVSLSTSIISRIDEFTFLTWTGHQFWLLNNLFIRP